MGTNSCVAAILADSPIALYKLDERAGSSVAADVSGNSYDGTYTSSPGLFKGKLGRRCITTDGTSHVVIPELVSAFPNGVSIEIFMAPTSVVSNSAIVGLSNGLDTNAIEIFRDGTNNNVRLQAGSTSIVTSSGSILTTKYTHIVATIANDGTAVVYLDNSVGVSGSVDALGSPSSRNTNYICKGVITGHGQTLANVVFCAVYDKVLTPTEVDDHYSLLYPEEFDGIEFPLVRVAATGTAKTSKSSGIVGVSGLNIGSVGSPWQNSGSFDSLSVSGTVLELGDPVARMVKVFRQDRPEVMIGHAISDSVTGAFSININGYSGEVIVMAYDSSDAPDFNCKVFSKVMGV